MVVATISLKNALIVTMQPMHMLSFVLNVVNHLSNEEHEVLKLAVVSIRLHW
jgi:hypothetical protein